AIGHKFDDALAIKEFTIVSDPNNIDFDWEKVGKGEFDITFEVAIKPEVTLGDYKGLEVAKVNTEVTDAEVDAEINALLKQGANLEPKAEGSLDMGDTAIFDFEGFLDGVPFEGGKAENFSLEIGSGQFIPGFEEGMVGLNVGEERDVNVTFPEQYGAEHLAGKPAVFKVKLHEIKVTVGAELNDAFVASLNREGVATVAELKASIAADLKKNKDLEAKNKITEEVVEKVVANASVDVPQEMFDQEVAIFKKNVENQAKQYQLDLNTYLQ